ncbi:MAG: hypothetical protein H6Q05_2636 [Acidobacteria bacterium]|nr:hypothetical protein [Acidobacteriota bacterium]
MRIMEPPAKPEACAANRARRPPAIARGISSSVGVRRRCSASRLPSLTSQLVPVIAQRSIERVNGINDSVQVSEGNIGGACIHIRACTGSDRPKSRKANRMSLAKGRRPQGQRTRSPPHNTRSFPRSEGPEPGVRFSLGRFRRHPSEEGEKATQRGLDAAGRSLRRERPYRCIMESRLPVAARRGRLPSILEIGHLSLDEFRHKKELGHPSKMQSTVGFHPRRLEMTQLISGADLPTRCCRYTLS